jgi:hypothetical protein
MLAAQMTSRGARPAVRRTMLLILLGALAGCGGSSGSSAAQAEPTSGATTSPPTAVQIAPITDRTVDELTSLAIPLASGSATGITFTATGLPAGAAVTGSTLGGVISAAAATATTDRRALKSQPFPVTITAHDAAGATVSSSFTLTVRDTHTVMPNYIGKYGCNGDGGCNEPVPNVSALTTPSFSCYAGAPGQQPEGSIWRQKPAPGTAIRWGAPATFWYFQPGKSDCQDVKKGW